MCSKCETEKSVKDFARNRWQRDGFNGRCRACVKKEAAEYAALNKEKRKEYNQKWQLKNADRVRAYNRQRPSSNAFFLTQYGIGLSDYKRLLEYQQGRCAICLRKSSRPVGSQRHRLSVDHVHSCCASNRKLCGKCVRGLLCASCNQAIGLFKEDSETLSRAVGYLSSPPAKKLFESFISASTSNMS